MYWKSTDPLSKQTMIVLLDGDTAIFFNDQSPYWDGYLAWVDEGNTAEEWTPEG